MPSTERKRSKLIRWGKRIVIWMLVCAAAYVAILLIGLIPVNNDFRPADGGIKLYVASNAVHADVIVPIATEVVDWNGEFRDTVFDGDISNETHVAFGWGDKRFFVETETWGDFKLSLAARAVLLPSECCVHVAFTRPEYYRDLASVTVTERQYGRLVEYIRETFKRDAKGQVIQVPEAAYSTTDAFFEANGRYHFLNTCNTWVGGGLKTAGVRVPWYSVLPKSPMLYIESEETAK